MTWVFWDILTIMASFTRSYTDSFSVTAASPFCTNLGKHNLEPRVFRLFVSGLSPAETME